MNYIRLYNNLKLCRRYCTPSKSILENRVASPKKKYLVPCKPTPSKIDLSKLPPRTKIDADTIAHLERLSLVDCANRQGIETLEDAIAFADQILQVDTTGVEPLITVLEDRPLGVREDEVTEGKCRKEILSNASITEEEYFVAPPGNIPLEPRDNLLHEDHSWNTEMPLKKILDLCEKHGFIRRFLKEGISKEVLKIGPAGALLQENLKSEWYYSMVINRDITVFLREDSITDSYDYAKKICQERLPFGLAEIVGEKNGDNYEDNLLLRTTMFVAPSSAVQFFHQWQRQRRMWWRKFSASPGRYSLTDIQSSANGQSVEIKADYPWGPQLIESLTLSNVGHEHLSLEQLQAKDGRKRVQAQYVSSSISLSSMVLNALCDAYDETPFQDEVKPVLRLHRKLAPYKISFSISASQSAMADELGQLALYLCKKLRTNHVSTLLLHTAVRNTLDSQWRHYDQLGIPYTVVLNEQTLKNGIAFLRSRDTTLKEQVHVSTLPEYVEKLFRNY